MKNVVLSVGVAFIATTVYAAYKYATTKCQYTELYVKRQKDYVKNNPDKFRVNNSGVSMDNREIYFLSLQELGL